MQECAAPVWWLICVYPVHPEQISHCNVKLQVRFSSIMSLWGVLKLLLNSLNLLCLIINDQLFCLQLLHSLFDIRLHIRYAVFMPTFLGLLSCQMAFQVNFSRFTFCAVLKKCCVRFTASFLSTSVLPTGTSIVFVLMAYSSDGRDNCLIQVTIVSAIPSRFATTQSRSDVMNVGALRTVNCYRTW